MFVFLSTLLAALAPQFSSAAPLEAPSVVPVPPVALGFGISQGPLSGTVNFTPTTPVLNATLSGATTGTVQMFLQSTGYVTGSASTSVGNSIYFNGYWSGNATAGYLRAACLYAFPPSAGDRHYFELKWDAGGNVVGGWCLY